MINGSDGRTIFRGAPKSWPPLDVWIKLLRRCLNGTPPAPEDVIAEVQKLASNADPPFREQDGGIRDDGHERYDEEGSGQDEGAGWEKTCESGGSVKSYPRGWAEGKMG